ncbi:phage tail protein [Enterobacter quasihormaechei]|uniref:phage tail fiber protein n=1 Tax=Enterobacter quasihormaechei TaxID=2529382 RepID=UPI0013F146CB|nr:phage tail protein [Enterobacter quasihormaechei]MBM7013619.1 phage tail protein [Enterobacter cloacae]
MSAGTLTLTNNSAAVTGSGTAFTTELAVGDFLVVTVGGIPYTLAIKTVNSNTSLTLVSNYTGPTQGGAAWYAVPRVAMNLVTAALVAQSAEALRGLNYDKQNWQRLFSASGNITVTLPDGSSFTGPSWQYMVNTVATKTNGAVPLNQGGTGSTTAEGGRTNLGLGNSATRDVDNQFAPVSSYINGAAVMAQVHRDYRTLASYDLITQYPLGMSFGIQLGANAWGGGSGADVYTGMLTLRGWHDATGGGYTSWQLASTSQGLKYRQGNGTVSGLTNVGFSTTHTLYSTQNTTKSSDGTLKAASPVARIVKSLEECQRTDIDEAGFVWCGCGTANAEAEGITLSRLDVGVYVLTGSAGLASEGWQLLPPMDPGGMGELGVVEAEQTESGGLTIRLYKQKYMLSDGGEIVKTKGEPMDVPVNSWIDVRLDMPTDSIFKCSQQRLQSDEES